MSRIELDTADRHSVDHARQTLADSEAAAVSCMDRTDLLCEIGRLEAAVSILLRVIDQTVR